MTERKDSDRKRRRYEIEALMNVAVQTNGGFKITPPDEVRKDVAILNDDDVIDRLAETFWQIDFRDGTEVVVKFGGLILFLYNFQKLQRKIRCVDELDADEPVQIKLISTLDYRKVMKPAVIRELINGLTAVRKGDVDARA